MVLFVVYTLAIIGLTWAGISLQPESARSQHLPYILNLVLLSVLSLLSFYAYRQERHYRGIFFQFWMLFATLALSGPAVIAATHYFPPYGGFVSYVLANIAVHTFFLWVAAKILLHYVFRDEKRWAVNALSAVVVFPLSIWLFWPYFWNPLALLKLPGAVSADTLYTPLTEASLVVNIVSLLMLVAFFMHKLRTDRPIGVFADTMLYLVGLDYVFDTADLVSRVTSIEALHMTQWVSSLVRVGILVTLVLRLKYKSQSIAHYYESQLLSFDPGIGRRVGWFDRLILWCFFDPKKIGQRIFLGTGPQAVKVLRASPRVSRAAPRD